MLEKALKSGKPHTRDAILQALGSLRDERAAPLFVYILNHTGYTGQLEGVYVSAIESLGRVAVDERSVSTLKEILYRGEWYAPSRTARIRAAAARALRAMGSASAERVLERGRRRRIRRGQARRQGGAGRTGAGPLGDPEGASDGSGHTPARGRRFHAAPERRAARRAALRAVASAGAARLRRARRVDHAAARRSAVDRDRHHRPGSDRRRHAAAAGRGNARRDDAPPQDAWHRAHRLRSRRHARGADDAGADHRASRAAAGTGHASGVEAERSARRAAIRCRTSASAGSRPTRRSRNPRPTSPPSAGSTPTRPTWPARCGKRRRPKARRIRRRRAR